MKVAIRIVSGALTAAVLTACGGVYVPSTPRYPVRTGPQAAPPPDGQAQAPLPAVPPADPAAANMPIYSISDLEYLLGPVALFSGMNCAARVLRLPVVR